MGKVVYNACYGGFGLSEEAKKLGEQLSGDPKWGNDIWNMERTDPILVQVVEQLGSEKASGIYAKLTIEHLKNGQLYRITEYDGMESVDTGYNDWRVA